MTSRAVKLKAHGVKALEVYELVTEPKPRASPGSVVVHMSVMPVNPSDLQPAMWTGIDLKDITVGGEGAGVVEEVGEGVTTFSAGQRVIPIVFNRYFGGFGVWRDYVEVSEADLIAVPEDISDEQAGQFFINPWLAYGIVKEINVPKGQWLVHNAAGSVAGRLIVQLAKHLGIKTICVVRRDDYKGELKALGADEVINSSTEDIVARVREFTGGKLAYGALDPVAGATTKMIAACVQNGGECLVYGRLSSNEVTVDLSELIRKVSVRFFMIDDHGDDLPKRKETADAVFQLLREKVFDLGVGKKFQLQEFMEAIKEAQKPGRGAEKILIVN
ncbi:unnamed protein product [Calypogeia fissa]